MGTLGVSDMNFCGEIEGLLMADRSVGDWGASDCGWFSSCKGIRIGCVSSVSSVSSVRVF